MSHEHLANNPTYPAKSRMGTQDLSGKTADFASVSHRWFVAYTDITLLEFTVLSVEMVHS